MKKKKSALFRVAAAVSALSVLLTLSAGVASAATGDVFVAANGFAAVGCVDTANNKAEVLMDAGVSGTVTYTGTAPTPGAVHSYVRDSQNRYSFTLLTSGTDGVSQFSDQTLSVNLPTWNGFWRYANGVVTYYEPSGGIPIFVRYSKTSWGLTQFTDDDRANGNDGNAKIQGYLLLNGKGEGSAGVKYGVSAVVVGRGDGKEPLAPAPDDYTACPRLGNLENKFDLSAISGKSVDAPAVAPENPGTNNAPGSGYAAVGDVVSAKKTAYVLLGDGSYGPVTYTGADPYPGAVHRYKKDGSNVFTFEYVTDSNFGMQDQLNRHGTTISATPRGWAWFGGSVFYPKGGGANFPIFIRYSATHWRLCHWGDLQEGSTSTTGYILDAEDMNQVANGNSYYHVNAILVGSVRDDGTIAEPEVSAMFGNPNWNVDLSAEGGSDVTAKPPVEKPVDPTGKTMKVLVVGNSFSGNSTKWLNNLLKSAGVPESNVQVSYLFIGSCSLETHAKNVRNNTAAYDYYRCSPSAGSWIIDGKISVKDALLDDDWDVVATHQSSEYGGIADTYNEDLDTLLDCFKQYAPNAKIFWLMTWAYGTQFPGPEFDHYGKDQEVMHQGILDAVQQKICPRQDIAKVAPLATVIHKMLEEGFTEEQVYSDARHLDVYGQYGVDLAFAVTLGFPLEDITYVPPGISDADAQKIKDIVAYAMENPGITRVDPVDPEPSTQPTESTVPETTVPETTEPASSSAATGDTQLPGWACSLIALAAALCVTGIILVVRKKKDPSK